ncbi:erythromycin esterase [Aquimarina sp. EL_43]|uniref:erythromycin esterase family protein n=1 Tax=unclassified Aquimarina TaxID=2627091 RepID=UPI0018CAFE52|nr:MULTISPECIES: erythromycin esterase family protein [unclassified Aquimarina]MBG6132178.1 erythromycin esterase [Aquimarina sp. EL_35]MBG6152975.1 erythromycin esterase [Aquimarina sp. EL_32]MBG6170982.1 erythromycin esterase [Aquimarina sp. EL_43]
MFLLFPLVFIAQEISFQFRIGQEIFIKGNKKHLYQVKLNKGELLQLHLLQKNVDLQIIALSPDNDTLQRFDAPNGKNGLEVVELSIEKSGMYHFEVSTLVPKRFTGSTRQKYIDNIDGSYIVSKYRIFSEKEHFQLQNRRKARKDSVISWIKDQSILVNDVKAETGLTDLSSIKSIFKDVQIVGLGETSHGTKEIFQMKHRMLEFLVKEMGFTIFAIEASHVGCKPINDYVLKGKGIIRDALTAQGFWIWNTEEVLEMIEWMKNYNQSVSENKKVKFIGVDTQMVGLDLAYERISDFVKKTNTNGLLIIDVDALFKKLKNNPNRNDMSLQRQKLYTLLSYLILNKAKLVDQTSKQIYEQIISDLRKIIQGVEVGDRKYRKTFDINIRDEYMAQTVLEILQNEKPGAKMVLWAHNTHISKNIKTKVSGKARPLGSILKEYIAEKYYAIGFSTNQGSFRAMNYNAKEKKYDKNAVFTLPPAKEGSLDWYFAQADKDIFFIDFVKSSRSKTVTTFLNQERKTYRGGASWSLDYGILPAFDISPGKNFDGMIFIKETSHSILTPAGEKEIEKRVKNNAH